MPLPFIALHTMMADEDSTEIFKLTYARLNTYQQDLATRWLDLRSNTLLYRFVVEFVHCITQRLYLIWDYQWNIFLSKYYPFTKLCVYYVYSQLCVEVVANSN